MKTLRTQKDGRITLPRAFSEKYQLKPGDPIDESRFELRDDVWSRRAILRYLAVGAAAMGIVSDFSGSIHFFSSLLGNRKRARAEAKPAEARPAGEEPLAERFAQEQLDPGDQELLHRLFGVSSECSIALAPAASHSFMKPWGVDPWYPIEGECCESYLKRFTKRVDLFYITGYPLIQEPDSIIAFGSQVSNAVTRKVLGDPKNQEPHFTVEGGSWRAGLHWNLHVFAEGPSQDLGSASRCSEVSRHGQDDDAGVFGTAGHSRVMDAFLQSEFAKQKHRFVGVGGETYEPALVDGKLTHDYLLITVLPRFRRDEMQRIIIFGAGHGPGQKATNLLLRRPPLQQLRALDREIHQSPFYQALFEVKLRENRNGESYPSSVQLVGAHSLKVS